MRTAFKVATVFTGAAACTAGFVPAATAMTAQTQQTQQTQQIKPDISVYNCPGFSSVLQFFWPPSAHHGPTCVSGPGNASLHNTAFTAYCTGGARGYFYANGQKISFYPDSYSSFIPAARITKVHISSSAPGGHCPTGQRPRLAG